MTNEEINQHYKACLDSVNLINAGKPEYMEDNEWVDCLKRNKDHLELMLTKDFWTDQDLRPLQLAVES